MQARLRRTYTPFRKKCSSKDAAAVAVADAIKSHPAGGSYEFTGALVERQPSVISVSGQSFISQRSVTSGAIAVMVEDLPNYKGIVHNQPKSTINQAVQKLVNRYPYDNDIRGVRELASAYPSFNIQDYVLYIVDEDWSVRAFPYSSWENLPKDADVQKRLDGEGLPPPIESRGGCN